MQQKYPCQKESILNGVYYHPQSHFQTFTPAEVSLRWLSAIRINETNTGPSRFGKKSVSRPESSPRHRQRLSQATCPMETFFQLSDRNNKIHYQTIASFGKYFHGWAHGTSFANIVFGHRNENGSVFKRALQLYWPLEVGGSERQSHISKSWLVCQGTKTAAVPLRALPHEEQGTTHDEGNCSGPHSYCSCSLFKGTSIQRLSCASIASASNVFHRTVEPGCELNSANGKVLLEVHQVTIQGPASPDTMENLNQNCIRFLYLVLTRACKTS